MSYYYVIQIAFSDKKLLKTIVKTNNLGKSIETLINSRDAKAVMLQAKEISEEEAKKKGSNNNE